MQVESGSGNLSWQLSRNGVTHRRGVTLDLPPGRYRFDVVKHRSGFNESVAIVRDSDDHGSDHAVEVAEGESVVLVCPMYTAIEKPVQPKSSEGKSDYEITISMMPEQPYFFTDSGGRDWWRFNTQAGFGGGKYSVEPIEGGFRAIFIK